MARKRNTYVLDDLLELGTLLPCKIAVPIALLAYLGFHHLSSLPPAKNVDPTQVGEVIMRQAIISFSGFLQYIVPVVLVVGVAVGIFRRRYRWELLETRSGIESLRDMSWQNFELLVGEAFKRKGYSVEERGGASADGGIDLVLRRDSKKILVQCKRWKNLSINVSHIRELFGVMVAEGANGCIFVTSGAYTIDALAFAKGKPVRLIDGEELVGIVADVQSTGYIKENSKFAMVKKTKEEMTCPICNSHMVLRKAKKGIHTGNEFWGCSRFPDCRGIRNT